jgi:predicted adenine nucleotide alpha hydrolase (AANH) superfamily ATPase
MKGLVHICCAPDSIYFLEKLKNDYKDYEWIGFFYDPNIHPKTEYDLRLVETKRVCEKLGIPLIEGKYDDDAWLLAVEGLEKEPEKGKRCEICFDIRLKESFEVAKNLGAEAITTTLLMSPKKSINQITHVASIFSKEYGIDFISVDYRKGGGVQIMHELTKLNEIYSQDYCGCIHGLFNQKPDTDLFMWAKMAPGSKEELFFIKNIRLLAESMGFYAKEINFSFLGWDLLSGYIFVDDKPIPSYIRYYSKPTNGVVKANIDFSISKEDVLYLTKQNVKIIFSKEFVADNKDVSPCFIVDDEYKGAILNSKKIKAHINSKLSYKDSTILIISKSPIQDIVSIKVYKTYAGYFDKPNLDVQSIFLNLKEDEAVAFVGAFDMGGYEKLTEFFDGKEISYNSWSLCDRVL